ncbi:sensor histidine kinase [Gorillibacterium sp. sgz500922]|uniref:sensor histidine kinase n=1 Tax=Gorillibacterium sp. sgz500922 TaxID=3446694 RepID=UPI003F67C7CA
MTSWTRYITAGLCLISLLLFFLYREEGRQADHAVNGVLDLAATSVSATPLIPLNGIWEFYWGKLLQPNDFAEGKQGKPGWMRVPGNWTKGTDGRSYANTGLATYRLKLEHVPPGMTFGIKKENIRNASRIYVNGTLVLENGEFNAQKTIVESNYPQTASFRLPVPTADIIVQVANHNYLIGGITGPLLFGTQEAIVLHNNRHMIAETFAATLILAIGVFYLLLYAGSSYFRRRDLAIFPFGLTCLFSAVMLGYLSQRTISLLLPGIGYWSLFRIGHMASYCSIIALILIVHRTHEPFLAKRVKQAITLVYACCIPCVALSPPAVFIRLAGVMGIVNLSVVLGVFISVLVSFYRGRAAVEASVHATLIAALYLVTVYTADVGLYSLGLKADMNIGILFLVLYSLSLAVLVIIRYYLIFRNSEQVSQALGKAEQRSRQSETAFLQAQIKPHFLFNALNSVISLCYLDGARAAEVLHKLSRYLHQSFDMDASSDYVTIAKELELIRLFVDIERVRFGERLQVDYAIDPDALGVRVIPLVIEPLVENAIRHGVMENREGGVIRLSIRRERERLWVTVEDNGKGMSAQQIQAVQEGGGRLRKAEGNGIGLININGRLREFYGTELRFETESHGTKVTFDVPAEAEEEEVRDDSSGTCG